MAAHRKPGELRAQVEGYLAEHPGADPREVATFTGHKYPSEVSDVMRRIQEGKPPKRQSRPRQAERHAAQEVMPHEPAPRPSALGAIIDSFGPVNGAELAGIYLEVPEVHNHGHRIVRDRAGQLHEIREL